MANSYLEAMVREFLAQEGHYLPVNNLLLGATPPSAANQTAVEAYMKRIGQGPSQEHPLFSWENSVAHPWNVAVVCILNQKFRTYVLQNALPKLIQLLGPSGPINPSALDLNKALDEAGDTKKLIAEKLENQQSRLRQARRKLHALQGQTEAEVEDALKGSLVTSRARARRQERKRNVCSNCPICSAASEADIILAILAPCYNYR